MSRWEVKSFGVGILDIHAIALQLANLLDNLEFGDSMYSLEEKWREGKRLKQQQWDLSTGRRCWEKDRVGL